MAQGMMARGVRGLGLALAAAWLVQAPVLPERLLDAARAQDVAIDLDEVTAAVKGEDVAIHARTNVEVDEMQLFIRKLLELGDFNGIPMEKTGATTFRYVLPLSQEQGEVGRLEYYLEAYRGGQPVAKTESFVISFIERPFVGELTKSEELAIPKDEFKDFTKGRISRPFYKRWWIYALAIPPAIVGTALLVGGGETQIGPPSTSIGVASSARRDPSFQFLCSGRPIPVALQLQGGVSPFEVIYTMRIAGGSAGVRVEGAGPLQRDQDIVVLPVRTYTIANPQTPSTQEEAIPTVTLTPPGGTTFGAALLQFSAITRDANASTRFTGVTPGQPLPASIRQAIGTDSRILTSSTTDAALVGVQGCQ